MRVYDGGLYTNVKESGVSAYTIGIEHNIECIVAGRVYTCVAHGDYKLFGLPSRFSVKKKKKKGPPLKIPGDAELMRPTTLGGGRNDNFNFL